MKIAILGTRGIPNNYGGPEQNAERLSRFFCEKGHQVIVYNPDDHPFRETSIGMVKIRRMFCKEKYLRIFGTFLYDMLCMWDARSRNYDVILQLGNVPAAAFYFLKTRKTAVITNMDGLEWKRSKWNRFLQMFAKYCESTGARQSDGLIADNLAIQAYLKRTYGLDSCFISYGADTPKPLNGEALRKNGLEARDYFCLIARMEPENNIEMILDGFLQADTGRDFIVIGKTTTPHAKYLLEKYAGRNNIRFLGGIYDYDELSELRGSARIYFHGHSVGGTNPSLVEAMSSGAFICAHRNEFNQAVLGEYAEYFDTTGDVSEVIRNYDETRRETFVAHNLDVVNQQHQWESLADQHLAYFQEVLEQRKA